MTVYILKSLEDTLDLGQIFAKNLAKPSCLCLEGELGTGKTSFSQGFAKGLGLQERITSPTFNLVHPYESIPPLFHFDVYRLTSFESLLDLDFESYLKQGHVLIEWANIFKKSLIDYDPIWIKFEHLSQGRSFEVYFPPNKLYDPLINQLNERFL